MFRLDRTRRAGRFLEWKVRLFTVGAVLALAGMFLEETWLVRVAMGVLAAGLLLRFLPAGALDGEPSDDDAPDAPPDDGSSGTTGGA